jgi:F-box/leucine-rich repeat protein 10/11
LKTPEKIPTGSEALLGAKIKSGSELEIPANDFLAGIEEAARLGNESEQLANSSPKTAEKSTLDPVRDLSKEVSTDAPAVCASCNFARNLLTIETENNATSWISCDGCKCWFHFACAGFKSEREVRAVDKYRCRKCKPLHGPTTYVRKSARAHSAIDYAGLHQGVLKTSDENPEHHYIKPIKDGIIKFNPENFARMQPELVTADYFQKGDGMKEPIVIPASMNPRPKPISNLDVTEIAKGETNSLQTVGVPDGPNDQSVLDKWLSQYFEYEAVPNHGQDALDMVIPQNLTVRMVSELYGPEEKVEVIDVKSQNGEDKKWNMRRWVDYYESKGNKVVRNVISLEVSQSKLGRLIRRPKIVRDLDLQDHVWPVELQAKGDYPKVQFYCLMSVADCFTDFHIDFGGSSVFYHILKGKKTFFFIPPHDRHLKKYEEWCMSPAQNWTFLGDQTKECYRVDLSEGDTMLIPAGWIHAVWTPEDSLVIGGNFLTPMHYQMQIRIAQIEKATGVARKFRYPHFQKLLWYAALYYLEDDPLPDSVTESLLSGQIFHREIPTHLDFHAWGDRSNPGTENYHSRYYSKHELDGLPELGRYLQRTALIAMGNITDGISVETRNAVKRSIPKGQGEPLEVVKKFAIWYTWKRGNEPIPHWAYPNHVPEGGAPELTEKKLSAAALKRLDREAALQAWRVAPDRQSTRRKSHPQNVFVELVNGEEIVGESQSGVSKTSSPAPTSDYKLSLKRKQESQQLPPVTTPVKRRKTEGGLVSSLNRKPACESCRKRRRACKHKEDPSFKYSLGSDTVEDSITIDSNHFLDHQMIPIQPDMNRCSMQNSSNEGHSTDDSGHQNRRSDESQESTHVDSAQEGQHQHSMNGLLQASPSPTAMDASWPSLMDNSLNVTIITPLKPGSRTKACSECRKSKVIYTKRNRL